MRKSVKNLVILLVVLAVLIGLSVGFAIYDKVKEKKALADAEAAIVNIGSLAEPTAIAFNGGGGEMLEFALEEGTWYYTGDKEYPLKQTFLTRIASLLVGYTAEQEIEISDSLSAYGLEEPAYTLTVSDDEGNDLELLIGTAVGEDYYYAMETGGDSICIIEATLVGYLDYTLYDMVILDTFDSVYEEDIESIQITYDGQEVYFEKQRDDNDEAIWYILIDGELIEESEYSVTGTDGESHTARKYLNDILDGFGGTYFSGCNGYNCTEAELEEYGLADPMMVTMTYITTDEEDNEVTAEMTFYFGAEFTYVDGSEYYYAQMDGSYAVNRMLEENVMPLFEAVSTLGTGTE